MSDDGEVTSKKLLRNAGRRPSGATRLAVLLAMAMFVLVVDTSLMNVSISAVIEDLDTTASGVQSAIALEALVSAAFILINSKVGDLIGRKRAYVLGLLAYAIGALAMTLAQSLTAIIIFWAIIGGLGASLLLPAMQSLIHGNFKGAAQKQAYALVGASAAIAAAVGPLLGGFVTTYLSWRVGFVLEVVIIAVVLSGIRLVRDVAVHGLAPDRHRRRASCPSSAWAASSSASSCGRRAASPSACSWRSARRAGRAGVVARAAQAGTGKLTLLDPDLFRLPNFRIGVTQQMLQQITLGGAMIALPLFLQMTLEYNAMEAGLSLAPLSLTMFAVAMLAGRRAGDRRPGTIMRAGFVLSTVGMVAIIPLVPRVDCGWALVIPLDDHGLRTRPARVPAEQLHPRPDRGGADQRGGRGELGRRVVRPLVRAGHGRRHHAGRAVARLHRDDRGQRRDPRGPAAADRRGARGRCRGHEQRPARRAARARSPRRCRRRSSPSTPTRGTCPCRWRCWCRASPVRSACSTGSGWPAFPTSPLGVAGRCRPRVTRQEAIRGVTPQT